MKKFLTAFAACVLLTFGTAAHAENVNPITLCFNGDVYSVDFIYEVSDGADITSVSLNVDNCMFDWNYIKSEAKLYLSIASGTPIPKTDALAVVSSGNEITLTPVSAIVNGSKIAKTAHTAGDCDYTAPGFDTPGHTGEVKCSECGFVLESEKEIPPTEPVVKAIISDEKTLMISGGLSDNETAEGVTYIAVYDQDHRLLRLYDATTLNQSNFKVEFENCRDASEVKIFRWKPENIQPLHNAVKIAVSD